MKKKIKKMKKVPIIKELKKRDLSIDGKLDELSTRLLEAVNAEKEAAARQAQAQHLSARPDEPPHVPDEALPRALPPDFTGDADPEEGAPPPGAFDDEPPAADPCFGLCSQPLRRACQLAVCCLVVLGICVGFFVSLLVMSVEDR